MQKQQVQKRSGRAAPIIQCGCYSVKSSFSHLTREPNFSIIHILIRKGTQMEREDLEQWFQEQREAQELFNRLGEWLNDREFELADEAQ